MSVETSFRAALLSYAPLVALVGQRVAQNAMPEGVAAPGQTFIVYTTTHDPILGLGGVSFGDQATVSVEVWATGALLADQAADAVVAALALLPPGTATVVARASGFDGDLGLDATVLSVEWWA